MRSDIMKGGVDRSLARDLMMAGGLIALVEDGGIIEYSIPKGTIKLKVSGEVLAERRARWQPPKPRRVRGYLARYAQMAASPRGGSQDDIRSRGTYGEAFK